METSTIHPQDKGGAAAQARQATQSLDLARFRMEAQRGIDMAAKLAHEGSEQAHALAQRLLAAVMLMLRTLLRVLARVLQDFKAGFGAGYDTQPPRDGGVADARQAADAVAETAQPSLEAETVAQSIDEALPTEVVAQDEATASKARRVVELTSNWAADHLEELTRAAADGEFHVWSPAIAAAMKALASDAAVLDSATKALDDAHAALHVAAAKAAERVGASQQVPLFTDALASMMRKSAQDNANGRHLLPRMIDSDGEFGIALRNYRDAAAAHQIAMDRVQAVLESAAPAGSKERLDLERAVHDAYPDLLQAQEISARDARAGQHQPQESASETPPDEVVATTGNHHFRALVTGEGSQSGSNESKLQATSNLLADDVPYERLSDDEVMSENVHRLGATRPNAFAVLYKGPIKRQAAEAMAATG